MCASWAALSVHALTFPEPKHRDVRSQVPFSDKLGAAEQGKVFHCSLCRLLWADHVCLCLRPLTQQAPKGSTCFSLRTTSQNLMGKGSPHQLGVASRHQGRNRPCCSGQLGVLQEPKVSMQPPEEILEPLVRPSMELPSEVDSLGSRAPHWSGQDFREWLRSL